MPQFFLQYRNDDLRVEDPEGSELPGLEAARAEAVRALREFVAERLRASRPIGTPQFDIQNVAGHLLAQVSLQDAIHGLFPDLPPALPPGLRQKNTWYGRLIG
jgi:hypothetical protein